MHVLNIVAAVFVIAGFVSALIIAVDLRSRPHTMRIMNLVWVLTGIWAGFGGLWAYFSFGRGKRRVPGNLVENKMQMPAGDQMQGMPSVPDKKMDPAMPMSGTAISDVSMKMENPDMVASGRMPMKMAMPGGGEMAMGQERPFWQSVALSTLHCGAGCTLADIVGEWMLHYVPATAGISLVLGGWILDYVLALCFGVFFQYVAIQSMQSLPKGQALTKALKADIFSLTAWQVGMYGWMAIVLFVLFRETGLPKTSWTFWFMMQIAMFFGFLFSMPMNRLLIKRGVKKKM